MKTKNAPLLSSISGGIHSHLVETKGKEDMDRVEEILRKAGFLYENRQDETMKSWIVSQTESGTTTLKYVTRLLPEAAGGLLRKSMRKKNITLNGKKMEGKEKLAAGDRIDIWFSDETISKFQGETGKT